MKSRFINVAAMCIIIPAVLIAQPTEQKQAWCAELHRFRGLFLAATGANETEVEATFSAAIRTAREQKSISLEKRAEGTYAISRAKARASGGRGFDYLFGDFL